jgi:hypothetical protein
LLKGPRAQPPTPVPDDALIDAYWSAICATFSALWEQHEPELRQRAAQWQWTPDEWPADEPDAAPLVHFYGEHRAWMVRTGRPGAAGL